MVRGAQTPRYACGTELIRSKNSPICLDVAYPYGAYFRLNSDLELRLDLISFTRELSIRRVIRNIDRICQKGTRLGPPAAGEMETL